MKRILVIVLSLFLALVGWSTVGADDGFYVIPTMKGNYAPVPKTGQTDSYGIIGTDGDLEKGITWATPRFTDNLNGTVTDKLTGLIWMKNANCIASHYAGFDSDGTPGDGAVTWDHALAFVAGINNETYPLCGAGYTDWRLPNRKELESLIDCGRAYPPLPENHPFDNVQFHYWSSTTVAGSPSYSSYAWRVVFAEGFVDFRLKDSNYCYVWCVRGGS